MEIAQDEIDGEFAKPRKTEEDLEAENKFSKLTNDDIDRQTGRHGEKQKQKD